MPAVGERSSDISNKSTKSGTNSGTDTDGHSGGQCRWCGAIFLDRPGPGRPRVYCSHSCRQQHYVERRTAIGDGRDPDKVVIDREAYELFESRRLQLQLAMDDVARAQDESGSVRPELYEWVLEYAKALLDLDLRNNSQ